MKKLSNITNSILLSGVLLLSGCSESGNSYTPGTNINSSLGISGSDILDSTSSLTSSDSIGNSESSGSTSNSKSTLKQSSDSNFLNIPTEFTEDDRALQKILADLVAGADEIDRLFVGMNLSENKYVFKLTANESTYEKTYQLIPDNAKTYPNGLFTIPQSREGMRALLKECFTSNAAEVYMQSVCKGSFMGSLDGSYLVRIDEGETPWFVEIDGKMYCDDSAMGIGPRINCETAKVISKTDELIKFSFIGYNLNPDYKNAPEYSWNDEGALKFEDGNWKLDGWGKNN